MAKAEKPKPAPKPKTKKEQYERFKETARELGVDDAQSAEEFEAAFAKIVPPKQKE
ncbi:MAG: hypothetical protein WCF20_08990 [Methylovirgula sp.]